MHYKNGREAHNGDPVIAETWKGSGVIVAGVLHSTQPGATSCNGQIAVPIPGGSNNYCVTVGECYHAADAWLAIDAQLEVTKPSTSTSVGAA